MKVRSRLRHAAAGLLGHLISRNNDIYGYWGTGLLYRDAGAQPCSVQLDLLRGTAIPPGDAAGRMAAQAAAFLRLALGKHAIAWRELTTATVTFQFDAAGPHPRFYFSCAGDPFICTVVLETTLGYSGAARAYGRCAPYRPGAYSQRAGG